ncbi:hypothetical protein ISS07_06280 [Candidatus Woesearchaeota archaeon]|nr:hypothetical protein [Candidatus Woesearchaeota archaeon]
MRWPKNKSSTIKVIVIVLLLSLSYLMIKSESEEDYDGVEIYSLGYLDILRDEKKPGYFGVGGLYNQEKNILALEISNNAGKEVVVDKILFVDVLDGSHVGNIENSDFRIADYTLGVGERIYVSMSLSELPSEVWVVTPEIDYDAIEENNSFVLSSKNIKIE